MWDSLAVTMELKLYDPVQPFLQFLQQEKIGHLMELTWTKSGQYGLRTIRKDPLFESRGEAYNCIIYF